MKRFEKAPEEDRALGLIAAFYYSLVIAALAIGLYGFFSLFWLATSAFEQTGYAATRLF
ncbi:MAG TPA: hypothetical protein VJQ56_12025 [Blastocatellia bacterium]|nr:hypothetical protein [Blastocatellia bacterium]